MSKSYRMLFLAALFLTASSVFAQGAVFVVTEPVSEKSFHNQITLVGRTSPIIESRIVSEVSGRVERIDAVEGTWVKKDSPLISIDSEKLKLALAAKTAEARQAQLQAELAKTQRQRADELYAKKLISETAIDSATTWALMQESNHQRLESERQQMAVDYENSVIKAPYSGYTGMRLVDVGGWVTPGMAVYEMVDLSKIKIITDLPEKYFGRLRIGSKVYVTVANSTESEVSGTVTGISPNASQETHTYPVIIEVDNSNGKLGGGMLVRATLSLDEEFKSLAISKDALIRMGDMTMVYTVDSGKAVSIPVTVTSTSDHFLAVQSQMLTPGMEVVIRGNERIYPGADVTTSEEPAGTPENAAGTEG